WYSHFLTIDQIIGQGWTASPATNIHFSPMWFDSTVLLRFTEGLSAIELSSVADYVDPAAYTQYNNPQSPLLGGDSTLIQVTRGVPYVIDSVSLLAGYVAVPGKSSIVDTLIISVQPQRFINFYTKTNASWINENPNVTDTSMYVFIPGADSVLRCAGVDDTAAIPGGVVWKQPLHPLTDADTVLKYFTYAVPSGGAHIPAGMRYAVSFTFKTGDTSTPNVDSVQQFNYFEPVWGYESSPPSWMTYWYGNRMGPTNSPADTNWHDENGSSLMDARNMGINTFYFGTLADQAFQNAFSPSGGNFPNQYLWSLSHIKCAGCYSIAQADSILNGDTTTAVKNLYNTVSSVIAYPSPANDVVYIPFTLNYNAQVSVTLTNTIGQMVRTQNMGNISAGKAVFYTSDLPSGTYIYSLKADGQTITGKISIAH
ncbi:MAG TPA: T9SS type A sorting domain-containing protein, partial [Flavipsychrobacter sp.]|nr:T9SS type A sorting domain-containing protein [Flavipsychrobacter sp.]